MVIRLGPVSAARSRPCPANGAGRAADHGLPRGELGSGRVVAVPRNNTGDVVSARDSNPHGPRPAAQQRGSGPRPVIISILVSVCRGLWPGRGQLRPRGALNMLGPPRGRDWQRRVSVLQGHVDVACRSGVAEKADLVHLITSAHGLMRSGGRYDSVSGCQGRRSMESRMKEFFGSSFRSASWASFSWHSLRDRVITKSGKTNVAPRCFKWVV